MHILELPYILERSIEIKLRFPISSNSRIMSATSPGEFLVAEPSVKNGPAESAKKARATEKKRLQKKKNLVSSEKSSPNLKLWIACPTLGRFVYPHAIISNTIGPDPLAAFLCCTSRPAMCFTCGSRSK